MLLSEYIKHLEDLLKTEGDIPVKSFYPNGEYGKAIKPTINFEKKLTGKQTKIKRWNSWDDPELKGNKFIGI